MFLVFWVNVLPVLWRETNSTILRSFQLENELALVLAPHSSIVIRRRQENDRPANHMRALVRTIGGSLDVLLFLFHIVSAHNRHMPIYALFSCDVYRKQYTNTKCKGASCLKRAEDANPRDLSLDLGISSLSNRCGVFLLYLAIFVRLWKCCITRPNHMHY